jgi:hypothetical protein
VVTVQMPLPVIEMFAGIEEHFFELCVHAGQRVLHAMMEADRTEQCGPKWIADAARTAQRAGSTASAVTLGGRRIVLRRLRAVARRHGARVAELHLGGGARSVGAAHARGDGDRREHAALRTQPRPAARRCGGARDLEERRVAPLRGPQRALLAEWLVRPLGALDLVAILIDGIYFDQRCVLIALGLDTNGHKHILGLHEGSTENTTVAKALLGDLIERGLDPERPRLFVIDGAKGLRRAIRDLWGARALWSSAARSTSAPLSAITCPRHFRRACSPPCTAPMTRRTPRRPSLSSNGWRARSNASTPAPPPRCARGWRKR